MSMFTLTIRAYCPLNGAPNFTAFIKITQALMGYTTHDAYVALILSSLTYYGNYIIQPKRSKIALPWPLSPPRTPALHRSFYAIGTFGP